MNARHPSKYFWSLDAELPTEILRQYETATQRRASGTLKRAVQMLSARIPVVPQAYLTPLSTKSARLEKAFFDELGMVIERIEAQTHGKLGGRERPLLLTVSGDYCGTVRNIGSSSSTLAGMCHMFGTAVAFTLYVDFLESFSTLVLGAPHTDFRRTFGLAAEREGGAGGLGQLSSERFLQHVREYQNLISQKIGKAFPDSPEKHLLATIQHCAQVSRENASGKDEIFVRAQLQRAVYGQSTQGVAYTRNPFTGKRDIYGVFQKSDGNESKKGPIESADDASEPSFRGQMPAAYGLLKRYLPEIEAAYRDVMEVEFVTDEDGRIFFTNFDKASTTAKATVVAAVDLNLDGKIDDATALSRIKPADVEVLLHPTLDDASRAKLTDVGSTGVTAAPGTAVGHVYFRMEDAMEHYKNAAKKKTDKRVILIANELLISDTPGLGIISGLGTKASGIASHAAVMARANGIPCLVGYKGLEIDPSYKFITVNGKRIEAGTLMTLEAGAEGKLYLGEGSLQNLSFKEGVVRDVSQLVTRVLAAEKSPMQVRVNINNAKDAETGLSFGADAVGLCRTENMFMEAEALREIRNIVFTQNPDICTESFDKLEEIQYQDYRKIFSVMRERFVSIRLMDLPLHDFSPQTDAQFKELDQQLPHLNEGQIRTVAEQLREHNPMLGLRACRFGLITPQVYDMQIRAIFRAAYSVLLENVQVNVGIKFPLVQSDAEISRLRARVVKIEEDIRQKLKVPFGTRLKYKVGGMLELPAAALSTDQLARVGEYFAFGTNDLTQTALGISRDDSAHYLPFYLENGLMAADPFKVLAPVVRELIEIAVSRGRRVRPDASFGICGEQGGDRGTLQFCLEKGLNYVSCSPFRVLPTRLALAQEVLARNAEKRSASERQSTDKAPTVRAA
jgi:pyruvate,orthophosphate dikinase